MAVLTEKGVIGRPVDISEDRRGNLYISDDLAGRIYKVSFNRVSQLEWKAQRKAK